MIRHRTTLLLALLLVSSSIALPVAPVSAAETDPFVDDVLVTDDDGDVDWIATAKNAAAATTSWVSGFKDRVALNVREYRNGEWSPDDVGDELEDEYNPYSSDFESDTNDRTTASTDLDVLEIEIVNERTDETATRYLVADVENGSYSNSSIVESTDRDVDSWVSLCGYAARNAPDELENFRETYVETGDDVPQSYLAEINGRYGDKIRSDLVGHPERCDD